MENNSDSHLQFETLNPSPLVFPSYRLRNQRQRRRPLNSHTYNTFIHILSICRDASFGSHCLQDDSGSGEAKQIHDVAIANGSIQDVDVSNKQVEVEEFDSVAVLREGNKEFAQEKNNVDSSFRSRVDESEAVNLVPDVVNDDRNDNHGEACNWAVEGYDGQIDEHCVVDVCDVDGDNLMKEAKGDEEIHVREVCESVEMSDLDVMDGKGTFGDCNVSKEMEQELQQRERELEKLISNSIDMDSSQRVPADDEIEEGEVSGEDGVYDGLVDVIFDDEMLPEDKVKEVQVCKEKVSGKDGNATTAKDGVHNFDYVASGKDLEIWNSDRDGSSLLEASGIMKQVDHASVSDHPMAGLEHPDPGRKVNPPNVAELQLSEIVGREPGASKKKNKRGSSTLARKERKKRNKRIKQAEENRKLGGHKRLKIQTVIKPKAVKLCQHYLKGRCHEGEKCKFSHDAIPLTKSKPCLHFARHSCMKGDDCPFDHQLSKYPCDNYATKGFCIRGANCLFSHKMPTNESPVTTSTASESVLKPPPMLSESKKLENIQQIVQQIVNTKSCSNGVSVGKSTENNVVGHIQKHITQAPRGVNILFHGKSSPIENGNQNQAGHVLASEKCPKFGQEKIQSGEDNSKSLKDSVESASTTRTPKGINFLSCGKASLNDSSSKVVSSLFPVCVSGTGYSVGGDVSRSKTSISSPKINDAVKVTNRCGQIGPVPPSTALRGINFSSLGKASSSGHPSAAESSNSHINDSNSALTYAHERKGTQLSYEDPSRMSYGLMMSSACLSTAKSNVGVCSSSKTSFLSNTPSLEQKALQSTLSFAAKFESEIKLRPFSSS